MEAKVNDYMTHQPHSIRPQETLAVAKKMMDDYKIRHLPVTENKKVVGLVSERDFALVHLYPDMDLKKSKVEDLMLQSVYLTKPDHLLKDVVKTMASEKFGCTVVIDDQQQLKGIFTSIDALKLLSKLYDV